MKNLLLAIVVTGVALCGVACSKDKRTTNPADEIALIPVPQEITIGQDYFTFNRRTAITLDNPNEELVNIARYFNEKTKQAIGFETSLEKHGKIEFKLTDDASLGKEGYHLQVKDVPQNATWLRVITYRNGQPSGKIISVAIKELQKRVEENQRLS